MCGSAASTRSVTRLPSPHIAQVGRQPVGAFGGPLDVVGDLERVQQAEGRALGQPDVAGDVGQAERLLVLAQHGEDVERAPDHLRVVLVVARARSRLSGGDGDGGTKTARWHSFAGIVPPASLRALRPTFEESRCVTFCLPASFVTVGRPRHRTLPRRRPSRLRRSSPASSVRRRATGPYKHPACLTELSNGDLYLVYYGGAGRVRAGHDGLRRPAAQGRDDVERARSAGAATRSVRSATASSGRRPMAWCGCSTWCASARRGAPRASRPRCRAIWPSPGRTRSRWSSKPA